MSARQSIVPLLSLFFVTGHKKEVLKKYDDDDHGGYGRSEVKLLSLEGERPRE